MSHHVSKFDTSAHLVSNLLPRINCIVKSHLYLFFYVVYVVLLIPR